MRLIISLLCLLVFLGMHARASHIVGGEIRMQATGAANNYALTLIQFWDRNTLTSNNRDNEIELLFYRKSDGRLVQRVRLPFTGSEPISYQNKACAAFRSLRTEIGKYSTILSLRPQDFSDPKGYFIVWERCCRNEDINNIEDPGSNGMAFYLEFPALTSVNSSPVLNLPNGNYICRDQPFTTRVFGTDADGDQLRFSLVRPMRGNTERDDTFGNASPRSQGYPAVEWSSGIADNNMIPGDPSLSVDEKSGQLTVTASRLGLYVFTVQCAEFRNGVQIGLVRRDFQLLVIECNQKSPPVPEILYKGNKISIIEYCSGPLPQLEVKDSPEWAYQWQLNGQNIPGATDARIAVRDTGRYSVIKSFKNECSRDTASQSVQLLEGTPPPASIARTQDSLCAGATLLLSTVQDATYDYTWIKNDVDLSEPTASILIKEAAWYKLIVKKRLNGCSARDSVKISIERISVTLPRTQGVILGKAIELIPQVESTARPIRYYWDPSTDLSSSSDSTPELHPTESRKYTLRVVSPLGCEAIDSVNIVVYRQLYIPDAFSPNGDGKNDKLIIENGSVQITDIRLYDRWGSVVYHSSGYDTPWDGRYQNQKDKFVPVGTYAYIIRTAYHTFKGTVLVLY